MARKGNEPLARPDGTELTHGCLGVPSIVKMVTLAGKT